MFNAKQVSDLKAKLSTILKRPDHWSETRIAKWSDNGLIEEEQRLSQADWWLREQRGSRDLSSINELLQNCGLGRLRSGDEVDPSLERRRAAQKKGNEKYSESTSASKSADELAPGETESIADWIGRLAMRVDSSHPFFKLLQAHAGKFRGDAPARKTLDAKMVKSFLDHFRKGGKR
jgi:hypothetical protein